MALMDGIAILVAVGIAVAFFRKYGRDHVEEERTPIPVVSSHQPSPVVPVPLIPVVWLFFALALIGFAASLGVHVASWFGTVPFPETYFFAFHVGIFVVWIPAVFVSQRMVKGYERKDFWKAAFRGTPPWTLKVFYVIFYYAIGNFLVFWSRGMFGSAKPDKGPPWQGFSGHWLIFYGAAAAMLYSSLHSYTHEWVCTNGHLAEANDKFCRECAQPVSRVIPRN